MKKIILFNICLLIFFKGISTNYYWVGNSGDWNDLNHWATSSGGSIKHITVPSPLDDVFFDANSFDNNGPYTVTVSTNVAFCRSMNWSNVPQNTRFASSIDYDIILRIYGSIELARGMDFAFKGVVSFESSEAGNTIKSAGNTFQFDVNFNGVGGVWSLLDSFSTVHAININCGTFFSQGHMISCGQFISYPVQIRQRVINIENSEVWVNGSSYRPRFSTGWETNGDSLTLISIGSTIRMRNQGPAFNHRGNSAQFYNISFENNPGLFEANGCIFNKVQFNNGWGVPGNDRAGFTNSNSYDSLIVFGNMYKQPLLIQVNEEVCLKNDRIKYLESHGLLRIAYDCMIGKAIIYDSAVISGENNFDTLHLKPSGAISLLSGKTQYVSKLLHFEGSLLEPVLVESDNYEFASYINCESASVIVNYTILHAIHALGPVLYTTSNTIDLGNNYGWLFGSQASKNLYWVGGSGSWNDPSHWSESSGGTGGTYIPTALDDVYFDLNSGFNESSKTVSIDCKNAYCRTMDWTGAVDNPIFSGDEALRIHGGLKLIPEMSVLFSGAILFQSSIEEQAITSAGHLFHSEIIFNGVGGGWILQDAFRTEKSIFLNYGNFNSNSQPLQSSRFLSYNNTLRKLTLENSEFTIITDEQDLPMWRIFDDRMELNTNNTNLIFSAVKPLISKSARLFDHAGKGNKYYNLFFSDAFKVRLGVTNCQFNKIKSDAGVSEISGLNSHIDTLLSKGLQMDFSGAIGYMHVDGKALISGSYRAAKAKYLNDAQFYGAGCIYDTLALAAGGNYIFEAGSTLSLTDTLIAEGSCDSVIMFKSSQSGTRANLQKINGAISISYATIQDIEVQSSGVNTAENCTDLGNNTGWVINSVLSKDLYWVGGSGDWSNPAHWSLTSGGPGGQCLPSPVDNVHFDANSFTATGQTVTVNILNAVCKDFLWEGALFTPVFIGSEELDINGNTVKFPLSIYGTFQLQPLMHFQFSGILNFFTNASATPIITAGHLIHGDVNLNSTGGAWVLHDDFTSDQYVRLFSGNFLTNGFRLQCRFFESNGTGMRTLDMRNSFMQIEEGFRFSGSGLTINSDSSILIFNSAKEYSSNYLYGSGDPVRFNIVIFDGADIKMRISKVSFRKIVANKPIIEYFKGAYNKIDSLIINQGMCEVCGFRLDTIDALVVKGQASLFHGNSIRYAKFYGNVQIQGSNTFDSLIFSPGTQITLQAGGTQTILKDLHMRGNYWYPIYLQSSVQGQQSTISKSSGEVSSDFVYMRDQLGIGGATFYAGRYSVDLGNNGNITPSVFNTKNTPLTDEPTTSVTVAANSWAFADAPGYSYGLGPSDTTLPGDSLVLSTVNFNGGYAWKWQDGSTQPTFKVRESGTYHVQVTYGGKDNTGLDSTYSDTINVTLLKPLSINYCNSFGATSREYIDRFRLTNVVDQLSGDNNGYGNFRSKIVQLKRGTSYAVTITPKWKSASRAEGYAVWIDYNKNGSFSDPGELVFSRSKTTSTAITGNFTVPANVAGGVTGMRVSMKYNAIPGPCEVNIAGEVEDYAAYIPALAPDISAPTAPTSLIARNVTSNSLQLKWSASTDNVGVIGYDVYRDNSLLATVTADSLLVTGLTPSTRYAFHVKAKDAAGNSSASSNVVDTVTRPVIYCASSSTGTNREYIRSFKMGGFENANNTFSGYSNYTSMNIDVVRGSGYTITVTPAWTGAVRSEAYRVWVDYNQDGDFADAGEQVMSQNKTSASSVAASITIPSSALTGSTRLRVSMKYNSLPTSCESGFSGEVEDYTIRISAPALVKAAAVVTAVEEMLSPSVVLYPNPVQDQFFLHFKGFERGPVIIRCIDMQGRVVMQRELVLAEGSAILPFVIPVLRSDLYFLQVIQKDRAYVLQFLKK